jgi:hypothetical protein
MATASGNGWRQRRQKIWAARHLGPSLPASRPARIHTRSDAVRLPQWHHLHDTAAARHSQPLPHRLRRQPHRRHRRRCTRRVHFQVLRAGRKSKATDGDEFDAEDSPGRGCAWTRIDSDRLGWRTSSFRRRPLSGSASRASVWASDVAVNGRGWGRTALLAHAAQPQGLTRRRVCVCAHARMRPRVCACARRASGAA